MTEIELKASLAGIGTEAVAARAAELGFAEESACREEDVYFNGCGRDFRRTDEALRLRTHTEGGRTETLVTYKGPKLDERSQTREEREAAVADGETMREIFLRLGFPEVMAVKKSRRSLHGGGKYAGTTLCLDEVDGLGPFLELETLAPDGTDGAEKESILDGMLSLLDELGVPRENLGRRSYLELLMARAMSKKSSQGV